MDGGLLKGVMHDMIRITARYRSEGRNGDADQMTNVIGNLIIAVNKSDMHVETHDIIKRLEAVNAEYKNPQG